jgi:hypothetical protein
MAKKNLINRTDIYEMVGQTADALIQLQITKSKAKDGFLLDMTVESALLSKGLSNVVEELHSKGKDVESFIDTEIHKNEQKLINLVSQLS